MKKIIFIFIAAFVFQHFYHGSLQGISPSQAAKAKHDNVILYATAWCGYCKKTRDFLAKHHIQYTEYDVENSDEGYNRHQALGGGGVPVLDIKGTIIRGYNTQTMQSVFKSYNLM